jgi:hypothetical protein
MLPPGIMGPMLYFILALFIKFTGTSIVLIRSILIMYIILQVGFIYLISNILIQRKNRMVSIASAVFLWINVYKYREYTKKRSNYDVTNVSRHIFLS